MNDMIIAATDEQDIDEVADLFATNVFGVMRVCQAALPQFRKQGAGTIVNLSSLGGVLAVPYMSAYTSAKFALEAMTEALYQEVRAEGIRVAIMQPSAMYMERPAEGAHLRVGKCVGADSFSHQVVKLMARDTEASDLKPEQVAEKIHAALTGSTSQFRVPMGRAAVLSKLKRVLPQRAVDRLIGNLMRDAASL